MKKITVYDWPTRIFHWLFSFLFLAAFVIAKTIDDDSSVFSYHMLAGLTILFLLIFRLIWGFWGTTYARFSSFKLKPAELFEYFRDSVRTKTKRYTGHNPASSYITVIMFVSVIGLAVTGLQMTNGADADIYEDVHELLANLFMAAVIVHVTGILLHQFRHKDALWSSMINGKKGSIPGEDGIAGAKPFVGVLLIMITFIWVIYIGSQYDSNTQTLDLFGAELSFGEENHESPSDVDSGDQEKWYDD
ncbi:MAG: cytochrome b/b6 domain-containing protein [Balneolaceae bacterium]